MESEGYPLVALLYSHEDESHAQWVRRLAQNLRRHGIDAVLDQFGSRPGESRYRWEAATVASAAKIVLVGTISYRLKWNGKGSGKPLGDMQFEVEQVLNRLASHYKNVQVHDANDPDRPPSPVLPILRRGKREDAFPDDVMGLGSIDFVDDAKYSESFRKLVANILGVESPSIVLQVLPDDAPAAERPEPIRSITWLHTQALDDTKREEPPPETQPGAARDERPHIGCIVVIDISKFTSLDRRKARESIKKLWDEVNRHSLVKDLRTYTHRDNTLDGVVIGFNHEVEPGEVLRFAEDLRNTLAEGTPKSVLRIGLHHGPFDYMAKPPARGDSDAGCIWVFGKGPNHARRLTNYADPGTIVLSEEFFTRLLDDADAAAEATMQRVEPGLSTNEAGVAYLRPPIQVRLNAAGPLELRVLVDVGSKQAMPSRLNTLHFIDDMLADCLKKIEELLVETITGLPGRAIPQVEKLWPRVSIFVRDLQLDFLTCRNYRYLRELPIRGAERKQLIQPGNTVYPTHGKGFGPVGRAFVEKKAITCLNLPDYDTDRSLYEQRMYDDFGMDAKFVERMGRKARAFVSIPIGIPTPTDKDSDVFAALCVDFDCSLAYPRILGQVASMFGEELIEMFNSTLAPLLLLRIYGQ